MKPIFTFFILILFFQTFVFAQTPADTTLMGATMRSDEKTVFTSLKEGANPNIATFENITPLMFASDMGNVYIVKQLLSYKADVNIKPLNGTTALLAACKKNHVEIAELLLEAGADVKAEDYDGYTPLFYAIRNGYPLLTDLLCKAGAPVELSFDEWKPLMMAAYYGDAEIIGVLLANFADANGVDIWKHTALMVAASENHLNCVEILINAGANVNAENSDGLTALDYASALGHIEIVKYLLEKGALPHAPDRTTTTKTIAEYYGYPDIVKLLSNNDLKTKKQAAFGRGFFGFTHHFNHTDYMIGLQGGIGELTWNLDFTAGYNIRPFRKKILIPERENYNTQYRSTQHELFVSAQKKISFYNKASTTFGMFAGGKAALYFGGYKGSENFFVKPKFVPEIGFYTQKTSTRLKLSYEYVTFEPKNLSAHVAVFSLVFVNQNALAVIPKTPNFN